MRFSGLVAIMVLLLACVVLGSACTGAQGEQGIQGIQGPTGATGATGAAGPQGPQGIQGEKGDPGLSGAGVAWKGAWSGSIPYGIHDAVEFQGSSYISRQSSNTNHVPTDTAWWDLWLGKGDTGATGATGTQGAKGDTGTQGLQGIQGIRGPAGPNMIVAMGVVGQDGSLLEGYNVTSSQLDSGVPAYRITLTGISYNHLNYVTQVTPLGPFLYADYSSYSGELIVYVCNNSGATVASFSFMILQCP